MPVLATVRNTGSNFALSILEQHYTRHYMREDLHGDPVWFSHTEAMWMPLIRERCSAYPPLILTMRDPMKVAKSWIKRGKAMDHGFRDMWTNLFRLAGDYESFWLPVDTKDRDERLRAIGDRLGKELVTDWEPVCSTGNDYQYREGMTLDECRDFFRGFDFAQFGYGDNSRNTK